MGRSTATGRSTPWMPLALLPVLLGCPSSGGEPDAGDADAGETRELHAVVLLGAGGFFGTSGETLDGLLGPDGLYGIGAHYADISGGVGEPVQAGRLYLFEGGPPPSSVADATLVLEPPDGAAAAGASFVETPTLLCAPSPASNDAFGSTIVPLGDPNGDGLRDFLVGMESHVEGDPFTGTQTGGVVFYL